METGHPVEASFGNEFPSIYNHCGVMAVLRENFQNSVAVSGPEKATFGLAKQLPVERQPLPV